MSDSVIYEPNKEVQQMAKEAIWTQAFTGTLLRNFSVEKLVPVQAEMIGRLSKTLYRLGNESFSYDAWKELEALAALGSTVAREVETIRTIQQQHHEQTGVPVNDDSKS